jgi:hypothetical protein
MGAIQTSQGAAEGRELTSPEARLNAKLRLMQAERSHSSGAPHILPDLTTLPQPGARPANIDPVEGRLLGSFAWIGAGASGGFAALAAGGGRQVPILGEASFLARHAGSSLAGDFALASGIHRCKSSP